MIVHILKYKDLNVKKIKILQKNNIILFRKFNSIDRILYYICRESEFVLNEIIGV
jgi:hypothetical protein